jgi:hypothetical protein
MKVDDIESSSDKEDSNKEYDIKAATKISKQQRIILVLVPQASLLEKSMTQRSYSRQHTIMYINPGQ